MKKTLLVILSLVLALSCFGLVACSKTDPQATLDMYIFEKDGQTISEDFVLPGTIGEFKATWSSNSDLITLTEVEADKENGIERQYVAKVGLPTERTAVDLTVLFKSKRISKTFTVYVNPLSVYDFSGSYNFVNNNGTVVEDFALDTSCEFKGHTATIAWSVDEEYANYLEISEDGKTCYVYPSSLNPQVKINATFTYNGVSTTKSYRMTVSEQKEPLQEVDYWYTNTGVGIVMSGYVVTIGTVYSDEYKNVTLYMVNDDFTAGYYLYRVKTDDANAALLQPGVHITVTETINTDYNGLMETNAGGNLVVDTDVAPINVSEKVYAVDNDIIGNLQSAYYNQSRLVSLTNWTVKEIKGTPDLSSGTQTLFVLTKGGVDVPVVISKYYEGAYAYKTSDATCSALIGLQSSLQVGDVVSVTGILGNYKGHQIAPLSASAVVKGGTADPEGTVYAGKTAAKAVATIDAIIAENGLDAAVVAVAKNVNLPAELEGCEVSYRIIGTPRSFAIDQGNLVINPGNMERACLTATITVDGFSTTIFRYITAADLDDAGKVEMEADALELDFTEIKENGSVSLPKASLFEGITISWESNNACAVVNGNSLRVVLPAEATTITLTATLTLGDAVLTKNFDVAVSAAPTTLYIPKLVSAPVEGQAYKFGFNQVKLGKTLYLTGVVSGRYLATTENTAEAVDVYVEAVEGGFKFYILDGETKLYLDVYLNGDGKDSLRFDANGENVFAYNAEVNAWATTHEGVAYYCGTYNDFDTMSASKLSYINASNTGVSQFPANLITMDFVEESAPACEHANTTTTTVDSTCLVKGSVTVTCDDCGETVSTEELPLADHTMAPATCLLPSTCTEDGCGHTEGEALGHNYVEGVCQNGCGIAQEHVHSWSDATCTAPKSCACGATEGEALGHTMADATCEDPSTCSVCGHTEGAALGHKYGAWVPGESDTHVRVCENDESHKETIATGDLLADIFAIADKSNNTTTYPNQVTLVGVVDNISYAYTPNATSITVDIKILNHSDYVVKCYKLAGAGIDTVAVGDTITATGTIKNYYATIEFDGCTLLDNEKHTCVASSTWGSDNDNHWHVCSICNAKLETAEHDFINGTCECGKQAGVQETTITVSIANYASANGWANSTQYTTMTMDNNISVTVNGGGNSGKYYTSGTNWRLYQSESAELTISAANGKTIKSVKITYVVNNSGCLTHNGSNITSGTVVTVNATTTTFGVGNTGTATNGQARVTAIEVVYY
ncbi:MAG: hypothetical protein IKJ19_07570 [Clostridia bacterium]|nr:hypothetical protein [Clostridia bacterium]